MKAMEKLMKKRINKGNARMDLHDLRQAPDERTETYVTKLKDAAVSCDYTINFTCKCKEVSVVNYSDNVLKDHLLFSMYCKDIKRKVLELNKDMSNLSLVDLTELIMRLETARRNAD